VIRTLSSPKIDNFSEETEDQILLRLANESRQAELASMHDDLELREVALQEALRRVDELTIAVEVARRESDSARAESETLRAECSTLRSMLANKRPVSDAASREHDAVAGQLDRMIGERDALTAASARWFEAIIAVTADHNPFMIAPNRSFAGWWRKIASRPYGKRGQPSPMSLTERARDAGQWELAVRYYRDALDP
jgi:hypothetical protein